jgi:hypothetical protein
MLQLGEDEFLPRLQSYVDVASVVRERVPNLDSVDLRFDDRIYVRTVGQRASGRKVAKEFGSEAIEKHDVKHKRQRRPKP